MALRLKPLREQVIVITGASSGIGLATAKMAAEAGARVVLVARSEETLSSLAEDIRRKGGQAIHFAADVADRPALDRVAASTIEQFGGFDTWVNDAGVSIWGKLEEISEEDARRLFDTNFWGVVNGSQIAVRHLKAKGGALINVGSVVSDVAFALQGIYSASKHAVKGFTDALRMELEHDRAPISVTLIKPGAIDTPFTQHARKYTAEQPKLPPPVYAPEEVAKAILHAAQRPKRDIYIGSSARTFSAINRTMPQMVDKLGSSVFYNQQLRDEPARETQGALYEGRGRGEIRGDHPGYVMKHSYYTEASRRPWLTSLALAAVGISAVALVNQTLGRRSASEVGDFAPEPSL